MGSRTWPDEYLQKGTKPEGAFQRRPLGQRVFIGTVGDEPRHLLKEPAVQAYRFAHLDTIQFFNQEVSPLTLIADRTALDCFRFRSFYLRSARPKSLAKNKRVLTPTDLSSSPGLFKGRLLPIHMALIQRGSKPAFFTSPQGEWK